MFKESDQSFSLFHKKSNYFAKTNDSLIISQKTNDSLIISQKTNDSLIKQIKFIEIIIHLVKYLSYKNIIFSLSRCFILYYKKLNILFLFYIKITKNLIHSHKILKKFLIIYIVIIKTK